MYGSGIKTPKFALLDDQGGAALEQPPHPLPLDRVIHFNHDTDEPAVTASHPSDAELRQHRIENKLLKRYLAVTKARFAQGRPAPDAASAQENAHESNQEDRLREEIAALRQQLDTAGEEGNQSQQQTRHELAQVKSELAALKESSEADGKRATEDLARLSRERFDLECALHELRERLNGDNAIEQMQITALQQSLSEANDKAELAAAVQSDEIEQLRTERATLQQQLQTLDSSLQELLQEKTELAGCLQAETSRALDFAEQARSLDRHGQRLEEELEAARQAGLDAESQHRNVMASQGDALKQAQLAIDELKQSLQQTNDTLQQSKDEVRAQQEKYDLALEHEKQQAGEAQSRLNERVENLHAELDTTRAKVEHQRKKRSKLVTLLKREYQCTEQLQQSLIASEEAAELANRQCATAEQAREELMHELQQALKSAQDAWEKALDCEMEAQVANQELAALKHEHEMSIDNLRAQLEHQQEFNEAALSRHIKENDDLKESLSGSQSTLEVAKASIRSLKRDRQSLNDANTKLQEQLAQAEAASKAKQAALSDTIESGRQEAASLKRKIDGLREVQLEMERHLETDKESEIAALRKALETAQAKLNMAEIHPHPHSEPIPESVHRDAPQG